MTYPLGLDVGTTYTAAAVWRDGRVQTVPLGNRADAVPSVLFLREDGTLLAGEAAVRRGITEPGRQAREFKRRMGDEVPILLGGQPFPAHVLTGQVLRWAVDRVAELQGGPPGHVVLTHPAEWGEYRRELLGAAARDAGLRDIGLLAEPVAAATWYATQERVAPGALIGIYDFGGGTFDASVVRKTATGVELYGEPGGDDSVGGVDFDHALFRHVGRAAGVDIDSLDVNDRTVAAGLGQLFAAVVEAKEALSSDVEAVIPVVLPGITTQVLVTRSEFEELIGAQVLGTVGVFGQVVRRAGVDPTKLHTVLLVGGTSRIPLVQRLLTSELGIRVAVDAHPKYTVSLGAAVAAAPRVSSPTSVGGAVRPGPPAPGQVRAFAPPPLPVTPPQLPGPPAQHEPLPGPPPWSPSGAAPAGIPFPHNGPPLQEDGPTHAFSRPPTGPTPPQAPSIPPLGAPPQVPSTALPGAPPQAPSIPPPGYQQGPSEPTPPQHAAPSAQPAVVAQVDLASTGLTAATDVPFTLPPIPAPAGAAGAVSVRTSEAAHSGPGRNRLVALGIVLAIVAAVAVIGVLVLRPGTDQQPSGPVASTGTQAPAIPSAGTLRLAGDLVGPPDGPDSMRAVAAMPSGDLVAVGGSLRLHPRAWIRRGGTWSAVEPPADGQATMNGVAVRGGTIVAVGSTGSGNRRRPAVWTSPDGSVWRLLDSAAQLAPGTGFTELTAVTVAPDGRFLAAALDHRSDTIDGDAALFASTDGQTWTLLPTTGLDGPGPQVINRITRTADGQLTAAGSALVGARRGAAIWTASDPAHWQPADIPTGAPPLSALTQQPDGTLLTCGATGSADRPTPTCWTRKPTQPWQRWDVVGTPTPLYVYDLLPTLAVGSALSGTTPDAATWTVTPAN